MYSVTQRGKTIELPVELYNRYQEKAEKRGIPVKIFVNDFLMMNLEKEDLLRKISPTLSFIGIDDNRILIRDKNRIADIYLKNHSLVCDLDKKTDCDHVRFALACPELGKLKVKA